MQNYNMWVWYLHFLSKTKKSGLMHRFIFNFLISYIRQAQPNVQQQQPDSKI